MLKEKEHPPPLLLKETTAMVEQDRYQRAKSSAALPGTQA